MARLAHYEKLVPPAWVDQLVRGQHPATYPGRGFVVFEVGWENASTYQTGHIPGARYFALDTYEHAPLWTRVSDATLAERLVAAGIRYDTTFVLYGRDTTAAACAAVLLMYAYHAIATQWHDWGITPDKRLAFYCGTGWRASEAFFYASLMGWVMIAVYDGGWGAWVQDPTNPLAVGASRSPLNGRLGSAVASELMLYSPR